MYLKNMKKIILTESGLKKYKGENKKVWKGNLYIFKDEEWFIVEIDRSRASCIDK